MDETPAQRQSGIPRLSRLPLPRASAAKSLRPSPSTDRLKADPGVDESKLRRPSIDHLSSVAGKTSPTTTSDAPRELASIDQPSRRVSSVQRLPQLRRASSRPAVLQNESTPKIQNATGATSEDNNRYGGLSAFTKKKTRPSLSERTVETLAQIPPSPSPGRRKSGIMPPQSPMGPPSRPASAIGGSRPSSAIGSRPLSRPSSPNKQVPPIPRFPKAPLNTSRKVSGSLNSKSSSARQVKPAATVKKTIHAEDAPSSKPSGRSTSSTKSSSKTMVVRSSKERPSLGILRTPSEGHVAPSKPDFTESRDSDTPSSDKKKGKGVPRSSLTLRETIAMAKKAARKSSAGMDGASMDNDPFGQLPKDGNKGLLRKRVEGARTSGHLNIAAMDLRDIPDEVMKMYDFDTSASGQWYESVDVVKFIAADNELETIRDDAFPDPSREDAEDSKGGIFGGVQVMDLHGNVLEELPSGVRRLKRLRVLNISNNKLNIEVFSVIVQLEALTELRIAHNDFGGTIPHEIGQLTSLEVLDLRGNFLEELPESLSELVQLRILQLANNKISSFPFECLANAPLTEINVSKNLLTGVLLPETVSSFPSLRILDASQNSLEALALHPVDMPKLQELSFDFNGAKRIADMTSWNSLFTVTSVDNKLSDLPEGFTTLTNLRNADFTGNDLTRLDERIGLMENLTNLNVASNPLRDRKFLTMGTEDIKQDLLDRLGPEYRQSSDEPSRDPNEYPSSNPDSWPVKSGGILDRSSTQLEALHESDLEAASSKVEIRSLVLHHNLLTQLPASLSAVAKALVNLDLSNNKLELSDPPSIDLPCLKSLNLNSNGLKNTHLLDNISAALLAHLDISCNRLTVLPCYRAQFPALITIVASDNAITELNVGAVKGLRALDVRGNNIGNLPPKLGLLGDTLRSLEVSGNTFRVPRYDVVQKGTDAVLAWLRNKLPPEDMESIPSDADSVD